MKTLHYYRENIITFIFNIFQLQEVGQTRQPQYGSL